MDLQAAQKAREEETASCIENSGATGGYKLSCDRFRVQGLGV